ncbi:MAG: zf-HC2 domain-containing protein [Candidatus Krumholzibacteria bacterium]|nr:zf-HC2 domain-containing protein [Candidatus Krumholzibacteria bacterium]MDH4337025.1 zf-HC2 domain-containing protein [Candidatus Krumholzibacteria bacterium]MDH5268562.1 zf-HC2 domain-containing protein [Candidatus Krumholzibacteria bacterium]
MQHHSDLVTCAWVRARIDEFSDGAEGGLGPGERAAVEDHAKGCAPCRAEIEAAHVLLNALRALPVHEVPASVVAAAEAAIASADRAVPVPHPRARQRGAVRWLPALAAAAGIVVVVATARWSDPVVTVSSGFAEARVERATREAVLALSYVNRYARMTGQIVTDEVLERGVVGSVERAIDTGVIAPRRNSSLRRALEKSGFVETKPEHERS